MSAHQDEGDVKPGEFVVWAPNGVYVFQSLVEAETFIATEFLPIKDQQITWDDNDFAVKGWWDTKEPT